MNFRSSKAQPKFRTLAGGGASSDAVPTGVPLAAAPPSGAQMAADAKIPRKTRGSSGADVLRQMPACPGMDPAGFYGDPRCQPTGKHGKRRPCVLCKMDIPALAHLRPVGMDKRPQVTSFCISCEMPLHGPGPLGAVKCP